MRIALVHSFYSSRQPSGENQAVLAQVDALRGAGHEVLLVAQYTDRTREERGFLINSAVGVAAGFGADPTTDLRKFSPDVVHLHNLFPNFGTRWLSRWEGPLVATLHNFRPLCANGLLYRDGHNCTLCPEGDRFASIRHACYHNSRIATLPLAVRNIRGLVHDAVVKRSNKILVLGQRARSVYEAYGISPRKMSLVPNFVTSLNAGVQSAPVHERWISAGRLSAEKGFVELLQTWPSGVSLDIVGDGPLRRQVEVSAPPGARVLGKMPPADLRLALPSYIGLVFPSRWREGAIPLLVLEALEAGIPVVAREGSDGADQIRSSGCGAVYGDHEPAGLSVALKTVRSSGDELRERAHATWQESFTVNKWVATTIRIYEEVGAGA